MKDFRLKHVDICGRKERTTRLWAHGSFVSTPYARINMYTNGRHVAELGLTKDSARALANWLMEYANAPESKL